MILTDYFFSEPWSRLSHIATTKIPHIRME
jgi:hypothetical protein